MSDDIDTWLKQLAQDEDGNGIDAELRRAARDADAAQVDEPGLQRLLRRMEHEGLLQPPVSRRWTQPLAIAASLMLAVSLGWWMLPLATPPDLVHEAAGPAGTASTPALARADAAPQADQRSRDSTQLRHELLEKPLDLADSSQSAEARSSAKRASSDRVTESAPGERDARPGAAASVAEASSPGPKIGAAMTEEPGRELLQKQQELADAGNKAETRAATKLADADRAATQQQAQRQAASAFARPPATDESPRQTVVISLRLDRRPLEAEAANWRQRVAALPGVTVTAAEPASALQWRLRWGNAQARDALLEILPPGTRYPQPLPDSGDALLLCLPPEEIR